MLLPRRLLVLAAAALAVCSAPTAMAADDKLIGWYPCSSFTFKGEFSEPSNSTTNAKPLLADGENLEAQCAIFKAPLCYDGVCKDSSKQEIEIFAKRIIGESADGKPNVIFMQGGPGAASPAMESAMRSLYETLGGKVNVYTLDHRGTGRSTKLDCVAAQAQMSGSPGGSSVTSDEVGGCAAELERRYGSDLSSFSVTSAASDLQLFISTYLAKSETYVYGVSYGVSLVERLMHLKTKEIAGYILDGISTSSGSDIKNFEYFSSWDPDYDEVGQLFLAQCDKNAEVCGKYFKGNGLAATVRSVVQKLSQTSSSCGNAIRRAYSAKLDGAGDAVQPDALVRQIFGGFLASEFRRNLIPALAYRLNRCNSDDEKVVEHLVTAMLDDSDSSEEDYFSSDLLYKLIVYSEFWEEPAPSQETMLARFLNTTMSSGSFTEVETYCVFSKNTTAACSDFAKAAKYDASPIIYKKDKYWNVAAKPDVSVLLLSSKLDPQTPHKYAEYLYKALDTDKKELVTFEHATHGTIWTTPLSDDPNAKVCGMELLASYVKSGGDLSKMDKSCVAAMPPINLKLDEKVMYKWLSTESAFDGKYDPKYAESVAETNTAGGASSSTEEGSSKSYKGGFIAALVLFIVATLAAGVFLFKWRRAKRQSASSSVQAYQSADGEV
ncbi:hypothetical protein PINS_up012050 [Pythium insidiosum]|nr:hypothetical protein PINS_up012050 [Pythium insidiosum]